MKVLVRAVCSLTLCSMMACVTQDQYSSIAQQRDSLKYELYKEQMLNYKLQGYVDSLYYSKIEPRNRYRPRSPKPPVRKIDPFSAEDSIQYLPPVEDQNPGPGYPQFKTYFKISNPKVKITHSSDSTIYILPENLLFRQGSTQLNAEGRNNLKEIAALLKERNDMLITVEGHTDNSEVSGVHGVSDNWDLSVQRATAVVRYMIASGVSPHLLRASGRSKFHPVASNQRETSRSLNRRIEIIIRPRNRRR